MTPYVFSSSSSVLPSCESKVCLLGRTGAVSVTAVRKSINGTEKRNRVNRRVWKVSVM
ncbi:Uncharacterized protein DAT39_022580, partial [Clarias magur]